MSWLNGLKLLGTAMEGRLLDDVITSALVVGAFELVPDVEATEASADVVAIDAASAIDANEATAEVDGTEAAADVEQIGAGDDDARMGSVAVLEAVWAAVDAVLIWCAFEVDVLGQKMTSFKYRRFLK